jgi:hypothetical protein
MSPCSSFQFASSWKEIAEDGQRCMTGSAPFRDSVVPGPHVSEGITLFACSSEDDSSRNVRSKGTGLTEGRRLVAEEGSNTLTRILRLVHRRPQIGNTCATLKEGSGFTKLEKEHNETSPQD